jgi:hypothetical protein
MDQVQLEFFRTDPVPCLIHIRVPLKENRLTSRETTILKSFCTEYHSTGFGGPGAIRYRELDEIRQLVSNRRESLCDNGKGRGCVELVQKRRPIYLDEEDSESEENTM